MAPLLAFQVKVGLVDKPVLPLAGDDRTGTVGTDPVVVKLQAEDQADVPKPLAALTRQ